MVEFQIEMDCMVCPTVKKTYRCLDGLWRASNGSVQAYDSFECRCQDEPGEANSALFSISEKLKSKKNIVLIKYSINFSQVGLILVCLTAPMSNIKDTIAVNVKTDGNTATERVLVCI